MRRLARECCAVPKVDSVDHARHSIRLGQGGVSWSLSKRPQNPRSSLSGEAIAGASRPRTAEAIVSAIEPDDRYSGVARRDTRYVAASRYRRSTSAVPWSYTQKLWMRVKRKAAYLPGC